MNKFEQLLDYLVNEETDKANELFHEIVVEKSREIYENLIAEEAEDDADQGDDDSVEEDSVEEEDDSVEEETTLEIGGDPADDLGTDVASPDDAMDMGGEEDPMAGDLGGDLGGGSLEDEVDDLKADFEKLKADFEALARGEEPGEDDEDPFAGDDEGDDEEGEEDEEGDDEEGEEDDEGGKMPFESRLREYTEKVSDGHGADKKGRGEDAGTNTKSVGLQNPSGRPTTTASAHNILGQKGGEAGIKGGEGLVGKEKGKFVGNNTHNVDGVKSGVKTLSKVPAGHGPEKKGTGEPGGTNTKSLVDRKQ